MFNVKVITQTCVYHENLLLFDITKSKIKNELFKTTFGTTNNPHTIYKI